MVGSRIAHYKLLRKVGAGGMGSVYEAVDEQNNQRVAIKLLRRDLTANREALTRFINEARATSLIAHPSLVKIYESGILPNGQAYLVMEFLDGEMLSTRIRRLQGPMPEMDVRLIGWQLASALAAANEKGIVHRGQFP